MAAAVLSIFLMGGMSAFVLSIGSEATENPQTAYSGDKAVAAGLGAMGAAPVESAPAPEAIPSSAPVAPEPSQPVRSSTPKTPSSPAAAGAPATGSPSTSCRQGCGVAFNGLPPGEPGSAVDPKGNYYLDCQGPVEIVPGNRGVVDCTLVSYYGFDGPVTLDCESSDGLTCTEPNGVVVNIGRDQTVAVKFFIDVPLGADPSPYTLFVRHNGDAFPKHPVPFLIQIVVPNTLPPCQTTALPLNCYMDPSKLIPTQP